MEVTSKIALLLSSVALCGVVGAPAAYAQENSAPAVEGTVIDQEGQPVAGATVIITRADDGTTEVARTDAAGRFSEANLAPGSQYSAMVQALGRADGPIREFSLTEGQRLTLELKAGQISGRIVAGEDSQIIVSARRKDEALIDAPLAVSVVPGDLINLSRTNDLRMLEALVPAVTVNRSQESSQSGVRIRGIGTEAFSAGIEPSVATYVDGVILGRTSSATAIAFNDLERIEVLRGPQGTLFGKNASVGVVHIITADPSFEFAGNLDIRVAEGDEFRIGATFSGPLSETVAYRISGFSFSREGHTRNVLPLSAGGQPLDGEDIWGLRGKLLWEPASNFKAKLTLEVTDVDRDCCARPFVSIDPALQPDLLGAEVGERSRETASDFPNEENNRSFGAILDLVYEPSFGGRLVSITGFRRNELESLTDLDFTGAPPTRPGNFFRKRDNPVFSNVDQFTQELRYESDATKPIRLQVGAFLFLQDDEFTNGRTNVRIEPDLGLDACPSGPTAPCSRFGTFTANLDWRSYAAFANVEFDVFETLTVFGGIRYTDEDLSFDYVRDDFDPAPFLGGDLRADFSVSEDDVSVMGGLRYQVTDNITSYFTYSQGFKGPGFEIFTFLDPDTLEPLNSESVESFEVGLKTQLFDERVYLNVAIFDQQVKDLALTAFDATVLQSRTFNAGQISSRGIEIDLLGQVTPELNLAGGLAYIDTKFDAFFGNCYLGQTEAEGCFDNGTRLVQDLAGEDVPRAPELKFNIFAEYAPTLVGTDIAPFIRTNFSYIGDQIFNINQDPFERQDAYAIVDLSFGIQKDNWELELFVENLFDEFYVDNRFRSGLTADGISTVNQLVPRDSERFFGGAFRLNF